MGCNGQGEGQHHFDIGKSCKTGKAVASARGALPHVSFEQLTCRVAAHVLQTHDIACA
jgi:hypothetical protein